MATEHSTLYYVIVALIFVTSGSMSTISSKWTDQLKAADSTGKVVSFNHPFFQTWLMFLGEFSCMIWFQGSVMWKQWKRIPLVEGVDYRKPVTPFIMLLPACCDFTASTTMYFGLTMTQASVYQMLRGAVVLFTAVFSRVFLGRRFQLYQISGVIIVTLGLTCVGLASTIYSGGKSEASNPVLGDILIVCAQFIVAGQMVIEEKILTKYNIPPTMLVGWEGTFGLTITTLALALFQAFPNPPDNVTDALYQLKDFRILLSCLLALASFPLLNGTGQIITKNISATARMVLDTVRNVVVWIFTLAYASYFHDKFQWLQLIGFILLIMGNATYRYIIRWPIGICRDANEKAEEKALINDEEAAV